MEENFSAKFVWNNRVESTTQKIGINQEIFKKRTLLFPC